MWSGVITMLLLWVFNVAWMVANFIVASMWISLQDGYVEHRLIRAFTVATGLQEMALGPLCHLPGQCWMVKKYLKYFSLSLKKHRLCTLLRSLSPNIPVSGWWSVTTITFRQLMINMCHFLSAQVIAAAWPSMGAYQHYASMQTKIKWL